MLYATVALFGAVAGLLFRGTLDPDQSRTVLNIVLSAANGALIGLGMLGMHDWFTWRYRDWLRRRPLIIEMALNGLAMAVAGVLVHIIVQIVLFDERLAGIISLLPFDAARFLALAAVFVTGVHVVRLIGAGQFVSIMVGRYRRPVEEWRIFLFVDVKGATRLAERLGPVAVATLLARFFHDVDEIITDHGGEVHAYVGDAIIVTWRLRSGVADAACVDCVFAMRDRMDHLAESYRREFGTVPEFRAALHCGLVVVSEIGLSKEQVTYFGDTVNVAARLESYAKQSNHDVVMSGDLHDRLGPVQTVAIEDLGPVSLRGRARPVHLYALEPKPS